MLLFGMWEEAGVPGGLASQSLPLKAKDQVQNLRVLIGPDWNLSCHINTNTKITAGEKKPHLQTEVLHAPSGTEEAQPCFYLQQT